MTTRYNYFLSFIIICFLLMTSVYLELYKGVIPCPLCTLQRFTFGLLGLLFLSGAIISAKLWQRYLLPLLSIITSLLGMALAGRQIWIQHSTLASPDECAVSIQYMMQVLPWHEVVKKIFAGSAECTQQSWTFLSLSMAEWSFIWFSLFLIFSFYLMLRKR